MKSTILLDSSSRNYGIGYTRSDSRRGKYHLMLTDNKKLFSTDKKDYVSTYTASIGFYTLAEVRVLADFLIHQTDHVLSAIWDNGKK